MRRTARADGAASGRDREEKGAKLSKALIKEGGKPAISAVVELFSSNVGFHKLAMTALNDEVAAVAAVYQTSTREALPAAAERLAARRMAESFKLASPNPSEKEVKVSLGSTLTVLTSL